MTDNLDVSAVWSRLTIEEKRDFHRQIMTGKIYSSIPVWTPWWQRASKELISSFPDDAEVESIPQISSALPLSQLISTKPHPSVAFAVTEVILGFSLTSRQVQDIFCRNTQFSHFNLIQQN